MTPTPTPVQTYMTTPSQPGWQLPAHACDAHVHVFGPTARFPYVPGLQKVPADAPKEALFAWHQRLGFTRCVVVQSAVHGMDNRVVEETLQAGGGRYLGVALVPVEVGLPELQRLAGLGFRGVRFNFMKHLGAGADPQALIALTHRLADCHMHLQVHFESSLIHTLGNVFKQSAVPVVIDHMARVDATLGAQHADFQALCRLLDDPMFHVKVSGIDRIDEKVPLASPPYPHGVALAKYLVDTFPTQCVWGSDWPHPNHTHVPDDGVLTDAIQRIATTPALVQALLVDNPQTLYRFEH